MFCTQQRKRNIYLRTRIITIAYYSKIHSRLHSFHNRSNHNRMENEITHTCYEFMLIKDQISKYAKFLHSEKKHIGLLFSIEEFCANLISSMNIGFFFRNCVNLTIVYFILIVITLCWRTCTNIKLKIDNP